ncbi:MAG: glycogen/starch synthase [Candidatus Aenigmatarchaeota archaeon]
MNENLKPTVLLVSAELKSFKSRAGGLGPAVEELAYALSKFGCKVSVVSLLYKYKRNERDEIEEIDYTDIPLEDLATISFWVSNEKVSANIKRVEKNGVTFYFLENERFANLLYEGDGLKRAIFLGRGTLDLVKLLDGIEVVHLNDAHTGLIPVFFKAEYRYHGDPKLKNLKFVYTIHNAGKAYQQIFDGERFWELGIGEEWREKVTWEGKINLTYAAVVLSDICNTVSPDYANTLLKNGEGLAEIFRSKKVFGITNGIDVDYWMMPEFKDVKSIKALKEKKKKAKIELLKEVEKIKGDRLSEEKLTIVIPRRFADQKGFEIFLNHVDEIVKDREEGGIGAQIIILGRAALGDPIGRRWVEVCKKLDEELDNKFVFIYGFNEELAKKMYWGGDLIIYPSLPEKEPCGTGYMMASINGTLTLGTDTGGMVDKIIDFKNGFKIGKENYSWEAFFEKLKKISELFYEKKGDWNKIVWAAFNTDVDINKVAKEYLTKLYFPALKK